MKAIRSLLLLLIIGVCSCRHPKDLVYQNMQHFKMQQCAMDQTAISMDIRLYNPNRYTVKLKNADIDVYMNGSSLGKMKVNGKYTFTKLDTCSLPVTLNIDVKNALPNAFQLLLNSKVSIKLKGVIKAGRHGIYIKIPIDYEGKEDILSGIKL